MPETLVIDWFCWNGTKTKLSTVWDGNSCTHYRPNRILGCCELWIDFFFFLPDVCNICHISARMMDALCELVRLLRCLLIHWAELIGFIDQLMDSLLGPLPCRDVVGPPRCSFIQLPKLWAKLFDLNSLQ